MSFSLKRNDSIFNLSLDAMKHVVYFLEIADVLDRTAVPNGQVREGRVAKYKLESVDGHPLSRDECFILAHALKSQSVDFLSSMFLEHGPTVPEKELIEYYELGQKLADWFLMVKPGDYISIN